MKVNKIGPESYTFQADQIKLQYLDTTDFLTKASSLRGSVMILGPLLARFGTGRLSKPRGDKIGQRRMDTHFTGIQKLGAEFHYDKKKEIYGKTTIYNAACAPYLQHLCDMLNRMGAKITGIGSNLLKIEGVKVCKTQKYHNCTSTIHKRC